MESMKNQGHDIQHWLSMNNQNKQSIPYLLRNIHYNDNVQGYQLLNHLLVWIVRDYIQANQWIHIERQLDSLIAQIMWSTPVELPQIVCADIYTILVVGGTYLNLKLQFVNIRASKSQIVSWVFAEMHNNLIVFTIGHLQNIFFNASTMGLGGNVDISDIQVHVLIS